MQQNKSGGQQQQQRRSLFEAFKSLKSKSATAPPHGTNTGSAINSQRDDQAISPGKLHVTVSQQSRALRARSLDQAIRIHSSSSSSSSSDSIRGADDNEDEGQDHDVMMGLKTPGSASTGIAAAAKLDTFDISQSTKDQIRAHTKARDDEWRVYSYPVHSLRFYDAPLTVPPPINDDTNAVNDENDAATPIATAQEDAIRFYPHELNDLYSFSEIETLQKSRSQYEHLLQSITQSDHKSQEQENEGTETTEHSENNDADDNDDDQSIVDLHLQFCDVALEQLESADIQIRHSAGMALLCFVSGLTTECESFEEQLRHVQLHTAILYECNALPVVIEILVKEFFEAAVSPVQGSSDQELQIRTRTLNLCCNILYTMLVAHCFASFARGDANGNDGETIRTEYIRQIGSIPRYKRGVLIDVLIKMLRESTIPSSPNVKQNLIPTKKALLILWKSIILVFGDCGCSATDPDEVISPSMKTKVTLDEYQAFLNTISWKQAIMRNVFNDAEQAWRNNLIESKDVQSNDRKSSPLPPRALLKNPSPIETFYRRAIPDIPAFILSLLKLILATIPSKTHTGTVNLKEQLAFWRQGQQDGAGRIPPADIDLNRHNDIVLCAISAILLVFLKQLKHNHVMQFQSAASILADANGLILLLKLFNGQELVASASGSSGFLRMTKERSKIEEQFMIFSQQSKIPVYEEPAQSSNSTADVINRRNLFTLINLYRVLHKVTKDNPSRISVLIRYKAQIITKKLLKVAHPHFRLYALKTIKSMIPFMKNRWHSSNMKVISLIYSHVRPNLSDIAWLTTPDEPTNAPAVNSDEQLRQKFRDFNRQNYSDWADYANSIPSSLSLSTGHDQLGTAIDDSDTAELSDSTFNDKFDSDYFGRPEYVFGEASTGHLVITTTEQLYNTIQLDDSFQKQPELWLDSIKYVT